MNNRNQGRPPNNPRQGTQNNSRRPPQKPQRQLTPEEKARREAYLRRKKHEEEARRRAEEEYAREMKLRQKKRDKARRKRQFKENMKILGGRLLIFSIILVIMFVLAALLFVFFFNRAPDETPDTGKMKYYCGGEEVRSEDIENCIKDGTVYICFNDISDYLGMSESGSVNTGMIFVIPDADIASTAEGTGEEEMITFLIDGNTVDINGQQVTLDIPNVFRDGEVWVSSIFVRDYMNNLSFNYDGKNAVKISRIKDEENSDDKQTYYLDVSFKLKEAAPIEPIPEDPLVGDIEFGDGQSGEDVYVIEFKSDLTEYEDYMNPTGDKRDAFLVLANTKNHLDASYVPDDLMDVKYTSSARSTQQLRLYAAKALEALYKEMHAYEYYDMAVYSGYRSYSYQDVLFTTYTANEMSANPSLTKEQAEAIVLTYSTRPGTSEHQTGLAVDMDTMGTFTTDFAYTDEYAWLQENAWKFGFILRFPEDKTEITTIQFEPWHYRYVGRYHAKKIHDSGLCLEEYIDYLNGN